MVNEEHHGCKIWLEENKASINRKKSATYSKLDFSLSKDEQVHIQHFLKKNKLRSEILIKAVWGLLLCRLSSSDDLLMGCSTASLLSTKKNSIHDAIQPIKIHIDAKYSIKSFLNKIQLQAAKKLTLSKSHAEDLRYLIIFKGKGKKINFTPFLNPNQMTLLLYLDIDNISKFSIMFNDILFSKKSIDSISQYFKVLLNEFCIHLSNKVVSLNILPESEKNKVLNKFNSPHFDFSIPQLSAATHDLFSSVAKKQPKHLAITMGDKKISYEELDRVSTKAAQLLMNSGVKCGDPVCVFMERSPTWVMSILAIFKAGATYIPINPKFPNDRIMHVLSEAKPTVLLRNEERTIPISTTIPTLLFSNDWSTYETTQLTHSLPAVNLSQVAYVIYTSGTTGKPKGVMIKHQSLTNLIAWYQGCFEISPNDHVSQFGSQGFDSHLCEISPALASGATLHIVDDNTKLTPSLFFNWLKNESITICDLTTAYAQLLFKMQWPENMSLRLLKIGGENLIHYPTEQMKFDVWNIYGPTETTIEDTFMKIHSAKNTSHPKGTPPIGKPIHGSCVYIVDAYMQPVPVGIPGELLIGGVVVSAGYLANETLTKEKFISNPFKNKNAETLYKTGDLARWMPDGNLEFIGRIDNQVKLRGYRIELSDIEHVISEAPDVNEVTVLLRENIHKEKSLIAYVVPDLNKQRYLYQQRCLVTLGNNQYHEAITEDISKHGVAIFGLSVNLVPGQNIQIQLKLPGFSDSKILTGSVIWQDGMRCGVAFDMPPDEMELVSKSIDFYITSNNVMELIMSASAKRSLRKALQNKIPDYMIPASFVTLMNLPLTLSGKIDTKSLPSPAEFDKLLNKEYIPAKTTSEKRLVDIWKNLLHKDTISMNDNFFDLGGTSLTAADLSVRIMNEFNTSIPAKILYDLSYIPILAEYIDSNGKHYSQQPFIDQELARDCMLANNITPTTILRTPNGAPKNILLTGAGGFLGIYMLRSLLKSTEAKIYCLIRKGDFDTPAKRLMDTVKKHKLEQDISLNDRRIVVIASDISFNNFGLPLEQYNNLLDKIDLIYHCGAQVNIMASYNKLRSSNVLGTYEIIKFATQHYDKPIHYISTLSSAYLKDDLGSLIEQFPDENHTELFGGYAISKWVSERILTAIKSKGLPISIYRSGYISGESHTGLTNTNDALLLLIKGCIQLGYAPQMNEKITILPVDFVSDAIVKISHLYPITSQVYHIDHPTGILWNDLISWLQQYGYNLKSIPMNEWQKMIIQLDKSNAIYPFLPYYLAIPDHQRSPLVSITHAENALREMNMSFPEINNQLLRTYFNYLVNINFMPHPQIA